MEKTNGLDKCEVKYFAVGTCIFVCDLVILCIMKVNNCPLFNGCAKDKTCFMVGYAVLWPALS